MRSWSASRRDEPAASGRTLPLFRSVDSIELATADVAPSARVDAALDALVG
jgi:hypothetical protein